MFLVLVLPKRFRKRIVDVLPSEGHVAEHAVGLLKATQKGSSIARPTRSGSALDARHTTTSRRVERLGTDVAALGHPDFKSGRMHFVLNQVDYDRKSQDAGITKTCLSKSKDDVCLSKSQDTHARTVTSFRSTFLQRCVGAAYAGWRCVAAGSRGLCTGRRVRLDDAPSCKSFTKTSHQKRRIAMPSKPKTI